MTFMDYPIQCEVNGLLCRVYLSIPRYRITRETECFCRKNTLNIFFGKKIRIMLSNALKNAPKTIFGEALK